MITLFLGLMAALCLITTILPLVPYSHGAFRVWEFPRLQSFLISTSVLAASLWLLPYNAVGITIINAALLASMVQLAHIFRYSPLWPFKSRRWDGDTKGHPNLRLLIANVKQGNRDYEPLKALLEEHEPDVAVFMETDQDWTDALGEVTGDYPFRLERPLDNSYGMLLVSRVSVIEHQVEELVKKGVPSFHLTMAFESGQHFRLIAIHPEPPLVHRPSVARDAEIILVARKVAQEPLPVIVTGDLNDVAWSKTTRRFLRFSKLVDPREGRGLFSSFDARYWFLRWPLDHVFYSPQFSFVNMQRLPFTGSDHFPMLFDFVLTQATDDPVQLEAASRFEEVIADQVVEEASELDEPPVGEEWEK